VKYFCKRISHSKPFLLGSIRYTEKYGCRWVVVDVEFCCGCQWDQSMTFRNIKTDSFFNIRNYLSQKFFLYLAKNKRQMVSVRIRVCKENEETIFFFWIFPIVFKRQDIVDSLIPCSFKVWAKFSLGNNFNLLFRLDNQKVIDIILFLNLLNHFSQIAVDIIFSP